MLQSTIIQLDMFADCMSHMWLILLVYVCIKIIMQNIFYRIKRYYANIITLIQSEALIIINSWQRAVNTS